MTLHYKYLSRSHSSFGSTGTLLHLVVWGPYIISFRITIAYESRLVFNNFTAANLIVWVSASKLRQCFGVDIIVVFLAFLVFLAWERGLEGIWGNSRGKKVIFPLTLNPQSLTLRSYFVSAPAHPMLTVFCAHPSVEIRIQKCCVYLSSR